MPLEDSILTSTKKILNLAEDYEVFDHDICTHINSTFAVINQLGVGAVDGFEIEDKTAKWSDFEVPPKYIRLMRTYMFLKVRMLFDPPNNSFLIGAIEKQIEEHEIRLSYYREEEHWTKPA